MSRAVHLSTGSDAVLGDLVAKISRQLQAGETVDLEALAGEYPDRAEMLRELVPAMPALAELGQSVDADTAVVKAAHHHPLAGQEPLGDYRILREIGRGGMGVVYEAEQLSLGRRVALKVLPFAVVLDDRHLQWFKNEAQASAMLKHPNIVSVYAVGCDRGVHHYAMEYIEGQSLAEVIDRARHARQASPGAADRLDDQLPIAPAPARAEVEAGARPGDRLRQPIDTKTDIQAIISTQGSPADGRVSRHAARTAVLSGFDGEDAIAGDVGRPFGV